LLAMAILNLELKKLGVEPPRDRCAFNPAPPPDRGL
jgi:hypothetical protein